MDLGQKSILHAIRTHRTPRKDLANKSDILYEEESPGSKPLCKTLLDLTLSPIEKLTAVSYEGDSSVKYPPK